MAAITIPDNVRPALAAIVKYRFWILAALVPLVLVPLLFVGAAGIRERITTQRRQIDAKLGQSRSVMAVQPHPNEGWQAAIETDVQAVELETLEEWRRFWHSQRNLRTWPTDLGDAFLADVASLEPGGKLDRQSLIRYQNMAPRLVRSLPAQMGVVDAMGENRPDGRLDQARAGAAPGLEPKLSWNPADQIRIYDSFVWPMAPNTTQVLMAQEELWVYGLFCKLLAGFVSKATGGHDSPLTFVDELAVGFPAGVGSGRQQSSQQRILLPKVATPGPEGDRGMEFPETGPPTEAPWHPRFTGGRSTPRPDAPVPGDQAAGSPEDDYRGWVYVDFDGRPLSAAELAANPAMRMVHLMPFVLRVVVDQRHLDRLLVTLAESPIPIDVRQVTVNGGDGGGPVESRRQPGGEATSGRRPNDLMVELRGTVALAGQPAIGPTTAQVPP